MVRQRHGHLRAHTALDRCPREEHDAHEHCIFHLPAPVAVRQSSHAAGQGQPVHVGLDIEIAFPHHAHHLLLHLVGAVDVRLALLPVRRPHMRTLPVVQVADRDLLAGNAVEEHDRVLKDAAQADDRQASEGGAHFPQ